MQTLNAKIVRSKVLEMEKDLFKLFLSSEQDIRERLTGRDVKPVFICSNAVTGAVMCVARSFQEAVYQFSCLVASAILANESKLRAKDPFSAMLDAALSRAVGDIVFSVVLPNKHTMAAQFVTVSTENGHVGVELNLEGTDASVYVVSKGSPNFDDLPSEFNTFGAGNFKMAMGANKAPKDASDNQMLAMALCADISQLLIVEALAVIRCVVGGDTTAVYAATVQNAQDTAEVDLSDFEDGAIISKALALVMSEAKKAGDKVRAYRE